VNDESPWNTRASHCKFAVSGFNSVITFVAYIYSQEMLRYDASCNALYLSGYLQHYFLRQRCKCVYELHIICTTHRELSSTLFCNLLDFEIRAAVTFVCPLNLLLLKYDFTSLHLYKISHNFSKQM